MTSIGIVGGSGYVAGELIRILVHHPTIEIDFIYSHSRSGEQVYHTHQDLFNYKEFVFTDTVNLQVSVVFLCLGHGHSKQFLSKHSFSTQTKIIDLSNDFRLKKDAVFNQKQFIYGLTALNKNKIKNAQYIANPGCFATAIQLALLPLADKQELKNDVHIHALTGSTGAGRSLSDTTHFSWRDSNISIYKAFRHQHLDEIRESLQSLQKGFDQNIDFLPLRGNFTRGIFASVYTKTNLSEETLVELYDDYYKNEPFTVVSHEPIHLKQVVNTNFNLLQVQKIDDKVLITSIIDNLQKGAAGQAIENMNLMMGWEVSEKQRFS